MNQKGFATISLLRFGLHKRSLHNRGFAPVLILLVVLAVGAVGYILIPKPGGIEYIKSQLTWPRPTPTPTPPPGCQYEEVICIQAPCPPVLVCPSPTPPGKALESQQRECEKRGGEWKLLGLAYQCKITHTDGGKACSDNSECQGECLAPEDVKAGERVGQKGRCSSYSPVVGCHSSVSSGVVTPMLCRD